MIHLKTEAELRSMEQANKIVWRVLNGLAAETQPGVTIRDLDTMAERWSLEMGGVPAFKGYRGYPASVCISVNEEVVHGIPGTRKLKEGDIVSMDFGVKLDGFYGDSAITVPVGEIDDDAKRLLDVTKKALMKGIGAMKEGNRVSDVSHAVQTYVEAEGYSVVRDFVGHGIGRALHEEPQVPNFGGAGTGPKLQPGLVLAIEPMVNEGGHEVTVDGDGWTVRTKDGSRSAHFEYSVAMTPSGPRILGVEA